MLEVTGKGVLLRVVVGRYFRRFELGLEGREVVIIYVLWVIRVKNYRKKIKVFRKGIVCGYSTFFF